MTEPFHNRGGLNVAIKSPDVNRKESFFLKISLVRLKVNQQLMGDLHS